jgi:Cd2+/Zn2+-exporting ATPase
MSVATRGSMPLPNLASDDPEGCVNCLERVAEQVRSVPGLLSVTPRLDPPGLEFDFDQDAVDVAEIERAITREAELVGARYVHHAFAIEGMDCADCARTLERGVGRLPGVARAEVNFGAARMTVEYDRTQVQRGLIDQRVRELGYAVASDAAPAGGEWSAVRRLLSRRDNALALAAGVLTLAGGLLALLDAPDWFSAGAFALAVAVGGLPIALKGLRAARATHSPDINLLMSIAVIGAAATGDWLEAATVVFLFALGESLEGYAMDRVRRSVRGLLSLAPQTALVKDPSGEREQPVAGIVPGATVIVRAGQRVPLDGVVLAGASSVDQSSLTGESVPVAKADGDPLFAGTLNGDGPLTMRVTRAVGDSSVARIIQLVEQAQARRAPAQRLVDRFARVYTPAVIAGAIGVALLPPLLGADWLEWFGRALVLLVIACPCALVLSTPISIVAALSAAARHGVLIKGGAALERAGQLDTFAFDKTGTLTAGRPELTRTLRLGALSERDVLALGATLERHADHPLGRALVRAAQGQGLTLAEVSGERSIPGSGLLASVDGVEYRIGSRRLFAATALTARVEDALTQIEGDGQTTVLLGEHERVLGVFGFGDVPRPEARAALQALRETGVEHFVILSGDRAPAAASIAGALGITRVSAELLPAQKLNAIAELRDEGRVVGMVGDGVNDAPSLAAADVGIAMGVAGSDAALEIADVALMGDDLRGLAATVRLGKRARRTILVNIALAIIVKLAVLGLAVVGIATLWMAIAADLGTALLVIANALRLLRWPARAAQSLDSSAAMS